MTAIIDRLLTMLVGRADSMWHAVLLSGSRSAKRRICKCGFPDDEVVSIVNHE
jgi:hypothetical protein